VTQYSGIANHSARGNEEEEDKKKFYFAEQIKITKQSTVKQ